jgi:hypothetical protein
MSLIPVSLSNQPLGQHQHTWLQPSHSGYNKHLVVCRQLCHSSPRFIMSTDWKISVLSPKLHKHDAFHEDWVWSDAEKNVNFSFYPSVENELATYGISSTDVFCDDCVGGSSCAMRKREMNVTLNQWWVLSNFVMLTKLLNHSFTYTQHWQTWQTEHYEFGVHAVSSEM